MSVPKSSVVLRCPAHILSGKHISINMVKDPHIVYTRVNLASEDFEGIEVAEL
jgi:hypothetical protein